MKAYFKKLAIVIILFANSSLGSAQADNFDILIKRNSIVGNLVYCTIFLNGQEIGTAFENNNLKIPTGTYKGLMRYNSGHDFVQSDLGKMSIKGDFLLEVSNVPGNQIPILRTDILMHSGNQPKHSKGCILLGPAQKGPDGGAFIDQNHPLRKLRLAFYGTDDPVSCPNKNITITVSDNYSIAGTYTNNEVVSGVAITTELTISKTGTTYSGVYKLMGGGQTDLINIPLINVTNNHLSFSVSVDGQTYTFLGDFTSDFKAINNFKEQTDPSSMTLKKN
ncbi:MAG: hypothetical protein JWO09_2658 [Bacteroidetes bacterium]|nr:hypothetical protein [Bacteroidota bacterium]